VICFLREEGERKIIMRTNFVTILSLFLQSIAGLPVILEGPRDARVRTGSSAIFKCRSSTSGVSTTWNKDGTVLYADQRNSLHSPQLGDIQILDDGTLVIRNVRRSAAGLYVCTVSDQTGITVSRPATLGVQDRTQKPRISHRPLRATVRVGDLIVLDCLASGYPPPQYTWYKDGGRLSPAHDRFTLAVNGSLLIENAQLDDAAHYRCSASNYLGKASSSARVQVETSDPPTPPRITTRPRNRSVQEGGIIELTCVAQGSPYPTITWWNNRRLVTANSRVTLSNGGQHLRIQDIEVYDQGDYTCVVENQLGREQITSVITVLPDNDPNRRRGGPAARQELSDWRFIQGASQSQDRSPVSQVSTEISSMQATVGSNILLHCSLQGVREQGVVWEKDGEQMEQDNYRLGADGSIILYNLRSRDAGQYSCMNTVSRERRMIAQVSVINQTGSAPLAPSSPSFSSPSFSSTSSSSLSSTPSFPSSSTSRSPSLNRPRGRQRAALQGGSRRNSQREGRPRVAEPALAETLSPTFIDSNAVEPEREVRYETDLSYDVSGSSPGDQFVLISLEEARRTVDRALNHTVELLFQHQQHTDRTPHQLLGLFRYPSETERELARAGEIYHRTLDLVEAKVAQGGNYNLSAPFSVHNLISPANIELIGNLSGCEAHRRDIDCEDICFHSVYRSLDGSCNNWGNPGWGSSLTPFRRILDPEYENGFNTPVGLDSARLYNGFSKPGAREVSLKLISTKQVTPDPSLTGMVMQWGQFLDHDLTHSMESISRETFGTGRTCSGSCSKEPPCFPIPIPQEDARSAEHECMEFTRSSASCGSGSTSVFFQRLQQREQVNQLTSFIDASQVYGSERTLAFSLRNLTNEFGRLREGIVYDHGKPLLPFNDGHPVDCRSDPRESSIGCFLTGDVRANEQLGLLALHTITFREHNRIVENLRQLNPWWSGDKLYEEGRKILGGIFQHITYTQWLPLIIGDEGMKELGEYKGYNTGVDPAVSNVFATAAFRFGHTLVNPVVTRLNSNFTQIPEGDISLGDAFFSPWRLVEEGGLDPLLRGLYFTPSKMPVPGEPMNSELTEKLFQVAHTVALDLAALNIQRGRDHGLAPYTTWVQHCRTADQAINSWQDLRALITDDRVLSKLQQIYGHPANIDLWVGGVLEDIVPGGRVGPTFRCILIEQFKRLRDGDRFWYEKPGVFTADQLAQIKAGSLASIVCNNGDDIGRVPTNVFRISGKTELVDCARINQPVFKPWKDCEGEEEGHGLLSRQRRATSFLEEDENGQTSFPTENLETAKDAEVATLLEKVERLEATIRRIEEQCAAPSVHGTVCLTHTGGFKQEGDSWTTSVQNATDRCLYCSCKAGAVQCFPGHC